MIKIRLNEYIQPIALMKVDSLRVVLAINNKLILNSVFQFCFGIPMLCMHCFLNNRNCGYYEIAEHRVLNLESLNIKMIID